VSLPQLFQFRYWWRSGCDGYSVLPYLLKPMFNLKQDRVGFVLNKMVLSPSVSLVNVISPKHHYLFVNLSQTLCHLINSQHP